MTLRRAAIGSWSAIVGLTFVGTETGCELGDTPLMRAGAWMSETCDAGASCEAGAQGTGSTASLAACNSAFVKVDPTKLPACGGGKGHCYAKAKTSGGDLFAACPGSSTDVRASGGPSEGLTDTDVCVPDEVLVAGGSRLTSCASIAGPGGCITASLIPALAQQASALTQSVCAAGQVCVPCNDPTHNNAPTPACQPVGVHAEVCSGPSAIADASAPTGAHVPCCTTNGKSNGLCVPPSTLSAGQQQGMVQDSCSQGNACVPMAFVTGANAGCNANGSVGVCIDKCFDAQLENGDQLGLTHDWCGPTAFCVPCSAVSGQGFPACG